MPKNRPNKIGEITDLENSKDLSKGREVFSVGDKVTVKSVPAVAIICFRPTKLELTAHPNLIGVPLTIESFQDPWIVCTRASGTYAPALLVEDLELWGGAPID